MRSVLSADKTPHTNKEEVYRYKVTARDVLSTICDPPRENRDKGDSTLTTRFHFKTKEFDFSTLKACSESCLITESFVSQDTLKTIKA